MIYPVLDMFPAGTSDFRYVSLSLWMSGPKDLIIIFTGDAPHISCLKLPYLLLLPMELSNPVGAIPVWFGRDGFLFIHDTQPWISPMFVKKKVVKICKHSGNPWLSNCV